MPTTPKSPYVFYASGKAGGWWKYTWFSPTYLAFAFDRDAANDAFLTKEETCQLFPRPAASGALYRPETPAQRQQARKEEQQRRAIQAAYPLLAEVLLSTAFTH